MLGIRELLCGLALGGGLLLGGNVEAGEAAAPAAVTSEAPVPSAERGYELLTHKPFLPPDFDQQVFDDLWKLWPAALREQARQATPAERRKMAFSRYGLVESLEHPGTGTAMGYLADGAGGWVMNCLACHGGKVAGRVWPGLPNTHFALQTLTEEVRLTKLMQAKKLGHMDLGMIKIPLGSTNGTTNSVSFGVALEALRDPDMNVHLEYPVPKILHHDLDAPPFWNVRKKTRLYYDGLVKKGHRPLIQFVMLPKNDAAVLKSWENDFRDILAWIESVEPPKYPWAIDRASAAAGRHIFEKKCATCHGTYGEHATYPNRMVDLEKLGTDPLRLLALSDSHRANFQHGWLGNYNTEEPVFLPKGYLAPPLDGIWASAPYLHNGSVPTLWHLLHPDERPTIWTRTEDGYDQSRVGLEATALEKLPATVTTAADRRRYFDTRLPGKSSAGHLFPNELSEDEKLAVLEYLKTL